MKVKRLIDVSLVEEWKTEIQESWLNAPLQQEQPKINSVNVAKLKPRSQLITPPDISGQKETVISTPEAEIKLLPAIVSATATSANSAVALPGIPGAGPHAAPAGTGTGFATQGKTMGNAGAISDLTDSQQRQGPPWDVSLRQKIRDSIQSNLVYPYIARKKRMEGTAMVAFRINQSGMPEEFRIVSSSGYAILDTAAKETVFKASPFPTAGKAIEIPITFLLKSN